MPEAIPPCGGAPIASASSRKPNFSRCSSGADAEVVEHLLLEPRLVDPERPAGELDPVRDEVVRHGARRARVGLEDLDAVVGRARERMVRRDPALVLFVPFRRGHVDDPQELPERLVDELELAAELQPEEAEHLRDQRAARPRRRAACAPARATARAAPARGTSRSASSPRRPSRKTRYARPFAPHDFAWFSSACTSVRENSCGTAR